MLKTFQINELHAGWGLFVTVNVRKGPFFLALQQKEIYLVHCSKSKVSDDHLLSFLDVSSLNSGRQFSAGSFFAFLTGFGGLHNGDVEGGSLRARLVFERGRLGRAACAAFGARR
jgi:hypothetical protein